MFVRAILFYTLKVTNSDILWDASYVKQMQNGWNLVDIM
jgi:hypothetical protein